MSPVARLTSTQIAYLIGVDHDDDEALLAVDEDSGEVVAVGRFVRSTGDPCLAEAAVLVIDDWQGCGLGKAMARAVSDRARALGIERFEATMLVDNRPMMGVMEWLGEVERTGTEGGTVSIELNLPEPRSAERMPGALRAGDDGYELAGEREGASARPTCGASSAAVRHSPHTTSSASRRPTASESRPISGGPMRKPP